MESKVHQVIWFQSSKYWIYFWNQFKNFLYNNLQKSLPLVTEIASPLIR